MRFEERIAIDRHIAGNPNAGDLGDGGRVRMFEYQCERGHVETRWCSEDDAAHEIRCDMCSLIHQVLALPELRAERIDA